MDSNNNNNSGGKWIVVVLGIALFVVGMIMCYQGGYGIGYGCSM